jgi:hypothetical protein
LKRIILAVLAVIGVTIVAIAVIGLIQPARLARFLPTHSSPVESGSPLVSFGQPPDISNAFSLIPRRMG